MERSTFTNMKIRRALLFTLLIFGVSTVQVKAQLDPLSAQYFNNQYLGNPAFAGAVEGLNLYGAYRTLWNTVPGAPLTQNIIADYGFDKVGVGFSLKNESAGIQRELKVAGTYAYHLKLNEMGRQLHFGASLGITSQSLQTGDIIGDLSDPSIGLYKERKSYLDGDVGLAYTSDHLNLQVAFPNLNGLFKKQDFRIVNQPTFFSAASYRVRLTEGQDAVGLEPKVAYRGIQGLPNIWDAGAEMTFIDRQILLMGLYHSSNSATFGLGMDFKRKYLISAMYSTQTAALTGYTNGSFELNLRFTLGKHL
jgi:type IX secretion system PorP/SprF family membrane protein